MTTGESNPANKIGGPASSRHNGRKCSDLRLTVLLTRRRRPLRRGGGVRSFHLRLPPVAQHRAPARRPLHHRARAARAARTNIISAPPAAASGRPPTAAPPGARSPTASSTARRWARWRSPNPTPTWSTSAWARPNCAATSCRATASTNPPTPAKPGSTSASPTRRPSRASASIPPNPDIVYVAALGHPYGRNAERGVFRSKDGGATWQKILYRDDHAGAVDLAIDPHNPNVLFAAIWDVYRTPWT